MNVRDRFLTLRLEPALTTLTKNEHISVGYLARRFNHSEAELQAWLDEFNGGSKVLVPARIEAVKRELGAITEGTSAATERRAPLAIAPAEPAPRPPVPAPAPPPPAPKPAPTAPPPSRAAASVTAGDDRPWETVAQPFKADRFWVWRPALEQLAEGKTLAEAARGRDMTAEGLAAYCYRWIGARTGNAPERVRAFIEWADARCDGRTETKASAPTRAPKSAKAPAAAPSPEPRAPSPEPRDDGRCDTRRAAQRQPAPVVAAPFAPAAGGTLFRLEILVRLVPAESGEVTP